MLTYTLDPPTTPTDGNLNNVEQITDRFLEEIFNLSYDFDPSITMEDFSVTLITNTDDNGVVTVDYEAMVSFGMDSAVVPTMEEVEQLISMAFDGLNLQVYLDLMQNTGSNNAFSGTTDVAYAPITPTARSSSASVTALERYSLSGMEILGVVGAGVIVLLGAAAMVHEQKSRKRRVARQRKVSLTI